MAFTNPVTVRLHLGRLNRIKRAKPRMTTQEVIQEFMKGREETKETKTATTRFQREKN